MRPPLCDHCLNRIENVLLVSLTAPEGEELNLDFCGQRCHAEWACARAGLRTLFMRDFQPKE